MPEQWSAWQTRPDSGRNRLQLYDLQHQADDFLNTMSNASSLTYQHVPLAEYPLSEEFTKMHQRMRRRSLWSIWYDTWKCRYTRHLLLFSLLRCSVLGIPLTQGTRSGTQQDTLQMGAMSRLASSQRRIGTKEIKSRTASAVCCHSVLKRTKSCVPKAWISVLCRPLERVLASSLVQLVSWM